MEYFITLGVDPLPIPSSWFDAVIGQRGALALMLLLLVAMVRGWLVSGVQHKQALKERDDWRTLALRGLTKGEELIELVEAK